MEFDVVYNLVTNNKAALPDEHGHGTCTEGWTKRLPLWQNTGSVDHPPLVANHMEENYQPHCC